MNTYKTWLLLLVALSQSVSHGLSISAPRSTTTKPTRSMIWRPSTTKPTPQSTTDSLSATALSNSVASLNGGGNVNGDDYTNIDWTAIAKYSVGLATQVSLMFGFLAAMDQVVAHVSLTTKIPLAVNIIFFYAFNLKSSWFSILPSSKKEEAKLSAKQQQQSSERSREYHQRKKPTWTPPPIAFVFGWPLLTFGLRAVTAAMVVQASGGRYATRAILPLLVHFGIGNLWNTVNNVERRLGVSVILLHGLWLSKALAAVQFYRVQPLAGKLLAATLTWITAAVALETRVWQINPDPLTGKKEPLLPMQHPKWTTQFRWET